MAILHGYNQTVADGTATSVVRPSDWNSAHHVAYTLTGNTGNASTASGTNVVLSGGNNITLIGSGSVIGISGPNALTTAMASNRGSDFVQATAAFSGVNASGTIASDGVTVSVGNYLTTAMASNRGSDFVAATAAFAGTSASGTIASNGLSISIGPYITTAALSDHSHGNPTLNLTNLSGTTASNSAGFTLSLSAAAPGAGGGIAAAAGTQTQTSGTLNFVNSNGVTFGMSGSSQVTASHNGLTTAMASNRGSDFVAATAAFAGTSASGTIASNGISVSIGPYITTAMLSNAATISNIRVSAGTTSNLLSALTFSNANGVTFGLNLSTLTASHNGLTTARASNDAVGLNTAQSNVTWTVNSSGLSLDARGYAGTATGATNASVTANSGGVSVSVGPYITTARASNDAIGLNTAQSNVTWTANSAGLSLDGRGYAGTGTSATNASVTLNSNGLAISVAAPGGGGETQLTAYAVSNTTQSSSGTLPLSLMSFAGAGIASVGITNGSVVISVPAGGGAGDGYNILAAGTQTAGTASSVLFNNANGITFGMSNSSVITASHNGITTGALSDHSHGNPSLALTNLGGTTASNSAGFTLSLNNTDDHFSAWSLVGNTAGTNSTALTTEGAMYFSGGPNITLSGNSNTIVVSAAAPGGGVTWDGTDQYNRALWTVMAHQQNTFKVDPFRVPAAFQFDKIIVPFNYSQATNSTLTVSNSISFGLYTKNGSTLSQLTSWSGSFSINGSGTASSGQNSGMRLATFGVTDTVTAGDYYLGFLWSSNTAGANASLSHVVAQNASTIFSGLIGQSNNATQMFRLGQGQGTVSTGALPSSIAFTNMRGQNSTHFRPQVVIFTSNYFI